jgi:hypothetical protein
MSKELHAQLKLNCFKKKLFDKKISSIASCMNEKKNRGKN